MKGGECMTLIDFMKEYAERLEESLLEIQMGQMEDQE